MKKRDKYGFTASLTLPLFSFLTVVHISRATYGILDDSSRVVDVTLEVQSMVEGRKLHIGTDVDLTKAFSKDPCPGMRKKFENRLRHKRVHRSRPCS